MSDEPFKVNILSEQMGQIARYEITFLDIVKAIPFGAAEGYPFGKMLFSFPELYDFTLEDLIEAMCNLKKKNPTMFEFRTCWFDLISQAPLAFSLNGYLDWSKVNKDIPFEGLPVTDHDAFMIVWRTFANACALNSSSATINDVLDLDLMIEECDMLMRNRGLDIEDRSFSDNMKEAYILRFSDDDVLNKVSDRELALAKKFVEELCEKKNESALRIKGYSCYLGDRMYDLDYEASCKCLKEAFELYSDPDYANTLGYIYYYGRVGEGPDYEKAFFYFSYGAAHNIPESIYKLGDLYLNGYGCKKNEFTAVTLYKRVYDSELEAYPLVEAYDTNLPDAALRMGNVFSKGICCEKDLEQAYVYYLQADYTARRRLEDDDFPGNEAVAASAAKALEDTRRELNPFYFDDINTTALLPNIFEELCEDGRICELTMMMGGSGVLLLTSKRVPSRRFPVVTPLFITYPHISKCDLITEVTLAVNNPEGIWFADEKDVIRYDFAEYNVDEERYEFFLCDDLVGWVKAENYSVYA